jgi:hypothetical protein
VEFLVRIEIFIPPGIEADALAELVPDSVDFQRRSSVPSRW